ncbi:MAG: chemotaxis protein CheD [Myxococcota bacterium]|nr:chemotaxis protein CheD [Myxococcota bacterium]
MSAALDWKHRPEVRVGISDLGLSRDPNGTVVTHALGSCIGVFIYDPVVKVGGCLHYMLPVAKGRQGNPAQFADTGVPLLFEKAYALGATKSNLVVKVCGGAEMNADSDMFKIGKRNFTVLRKLFYRAGVVMAATDVGGHESRTGRLYLDTGKLIVTKGGKEWEL